MRKYYLIAGLTAIIYLPVSAQTWHEEKESQIRHEIDSLKKILPTRKGNDKVDCLNTIAHKFFYAYSLSINERMDSSYFYSIQANKEAKRLGYKKGLGHSYGRLASIDNGRFNASTYAGKPDSSYIKNARKNIDQAFLIGQELNDNIILGGSNWQRAWLATLNNDIYNYINYLKKAVSHFEKVTKLTREAYKEQDYADCAGCEGNEYWLGNLYDELSEAYFEIKDFDAEIDALKKAISLHHKSENLRREIFSMWNLSGKLIIQGNFESAFEYCERNIKLTEELDRLKNKQHNGWTSGQSFSLMAELYKTAGDYETALHYIRRGHDYFPIDSFSTDLWVSQMGDIHRLIGNYDSAMYYLAPFTNRPQEFVLTAMTNSGTLNLCILYSTLKEYDKAISLAKVFNSKKQPAAQGIVLLVTANAYFGKKNYPIALRYAREGLALLKSMKIRVQMVENYKLLSEIFNTLERYDSAYFYLNEYTALKDSLLNRQFYFRLNSYKKQVEEERKTSWINLLNKDNQLKEQKLKQEATLKKSLIAGLVLLSLLAVFIFRTLTLKRKSALQKQQLENEKKQAELQQKATELEMQALRAQMNPHFIFNCLSSINKFILKNDTDTASDYLTRFSRLIRQSLTNSQLSLIPLSDEIEMLRLYLDMERLRFSETFTYNIVYENTIEPETIYIPPMLLQPFCENAIWHGLMHKEGPGKLEIIMSLQNGELQCIIADNGVGREKAAELKSRSNGKQKSFGLKITTERLALFNDEKAVHSFYKTEDVLDPNGNIAGTMVILNIKFKNSVQQHVKETV